MSIKDIIKNGEGKTLEFKEVLPQNTSITKTVVAFSNTSGGKLIIGVNDNKEVVGINVENIVDLKDKVASIIYDTCSPPVFPEINIFNVNDKIILVIEVVKGAYSPYFIRNEGLPDGCYVRLGATNRKAGLDRIAELERQKNRISFDEEINRVFELKDLDPTSLVSRFNDCGKELDTNKMLNLKLLKKDYDIALPTNALALILGKYEHSQVKCAKFKGVNMEYYIDKKEYSGNIFDILENSLSFILNHLNLSAEIRGLARTDIYEIPTVAIREALVNALVHRDYTNDGRDVKVNIYDDRIDIISPGAFPYTITLEDVLAGRSEIRNKAIARVFKELNLIEQWGGGINRILAACKEYGLTTPIIEEKNDFVGIRFFRPIKETTTANTKSKVADTYEIPADSKSIVADTYKIPADSKSIVANTYEIPADSKSKVADTYVIPADSKSKVADTYVISADSKSIVADTSVEVADTSKIEVNRLQHILKDKSLLLHSLRLEIYKMKVDSANPPKINESQIDIILDYFENANEINTNIVKELLHVKDARARRILKELVNIDIFEKKGAARATYYVLKDNC